MRSIELFAGAGGLGMGVAAAGFKAAAVIERDRYCCDTLRENQAKRLKHLVGWPLLEADVRRVKFNELASGVDLVAGGPPCQPFSIGGKHAAYNDDRDMFPEAVRALRELQPRAFLFENVKGLTRAKFSTYFEYIRLQMTYPDVVRGKYEDWEEHLSTLERHHTHRKTRGLTYQIVARVLNAADYGVPQRRERVFIVGFRSDLAVEWNFPNPTHSSDALLWSQFCDHSYWERHEVSRKARFMTDRAIARAKRLSEMPRLKPWNTIRDALEGLPDPVTYRGKDFLNHSYQPGARAYTGHTGSQLDQPAKTLKAGVHGVPGGENMLVLADGAVRYFTVRESARLQTFSDDFVFHGSWSETMRQLGNAVPVRMATVLAKSIATHLKANN